MGRISFAGVFVTAILVGFFAYGYWSLQVRLAGLEGRPSQIDTPVVDRTGEESLRGEVQELTRKVENLRTSSATGSLPAMVDLVPSLRADIDKLASQVAELRRGLDNLELQVASIGSASRSQRPGPDVSKLETQENRINEQKVDRSEQLKIRHDEEIRSQQWATRMEIAVKTEFANNPAVADVIIDDLDCRATLCRLAWRFPEGLSNEKAFVLENEFMFALGKAGLNAAHRITGSSGSNEAVFWHQEPPSRKQM